jgi:iron(III) transport system substrate-binding protein
MSRRNAAAESSTDRRAFLRGACATAGTAALAGCFGESDGDGTTDGDPTANGTGEGTAAAETDRTTTATSGTGSPGESTGSEPGQIGSGRRGRESPGGTPMAAMPPLEGEINVYSGRGEALVGELVATIEERYPDLDLEMRYAGANALANQIINEGSNSPADVFFSVNAGALGLLADENHTQRLPDGVLEMVPSEFRADEGMWVGTSGRARSIPYNTEAFEDGAIPEDVFAFPNADRFDGAMGWAPSYSSFQGFVTAMRVLNGEGRTKEWLRGMVESGITNYSDEFVVAQAIADGEIAAGFTNHYYPQRVLDGRPDAPLATAFTRNDAGAVFNVAGAAVVSATGRAEMAANFVRHLLSAEAQDYFARTTFEYPTVPAVEPIGALPAIDELHPPEIDLAKLSDLEPTIDLLREVGVL